MSNSREQEQTPRATGSAGVGKTAGQKRHFLAHTNLRFFVIHSDDGWCGQNIGIAITGKKIRNCGNAGAILRNTADAKRQAAADTRQGCRVTKKGSTHVDDTGAGV